MDNAVLNLLHKVNELVERDFNAKIINKLSDLGGVSLKTSHYGFQVLNINCLIFFFVEQIKDFLQVLHFILCELLHLLGLMTHGLFLFLEHFLVGGNLGSTALELIKFLCLHRVLFKLLVAHF